MAVIVILLVVNRYSISVYYVEDYCRDVKSVIDGAKEYIDVALYLMRYKDPGECPEVLVESLAEAKLRGVRVTVFLYDDNYNKGAIEFLKRFEVNVIVVKDAFLHAKTLRTEGCFVVGSHNWTRNAMKKNVEASVIVCGSDVMRPFWEKVYSLERG